MSDIMRPPAEPEERPPQQRGGHRPWLIFAGVGLAGLLIGGGIAGGLIAGGGSTTTAQDTVATAPVTPVPSVPYTPWEEPSVPAEPTVPATPAEPAVPAVPSTPSSAREYLESRGYTVVMEWTPQEFAAQTGSADAAALIDGVAGGVSSDGDVDVIVDLSPAGQQAMAQPGGWDAFMSGLNSGDEQYTADLDGGFVVVHGYLAGISS